jgi:hypothetical protein
MGIRLIEGRRLSFEDTHDSARVAVVNQTFARVFTGGASPIGKTLRTSPEPNYPATDYLIVGVFADTKYDDIRRETPGDGLLSRLPVPDAGAVSRVVRQTSSRHARGARKYNIRMQEPAESVALVLEGREQRNVPRLVKGQDDGDLVPPVVRGSAHRRRRSDTGGSRCASDTAVLLENRAAADESDAGKQAFEHSRLRLAISREDAGCEEDVSAGRRRDQRERAETGAALALLTVPGHGYSEHERRGNSRETRDHGSHSERVRGH